MPQPLKILLVNPVIHDFAAYDFWAKPLGLLRIGGALKSMGHKIALLDCMDAASPYLPKSDRPKRKETGQGRFFREAIDKPALLPDINRRYARYGLPPSAIRQALQEIEPPDWALVTSGMTYWYPGVIETIALLREAWPKVKIALGGVYATLCKAHAKALSGADVVIESGGDEAFSALMKALNLEARPDAYHDALPLFDLYPTLHSAAFQASTGCPNRCLYCSVKAIHKGYRRFSHEKALRAYRHLALDLKAKDVALYDDAFLADEKEARKLLEAIAKLALKPRIHAASGLSCRGLTLGVAQAMKAANFRTIRLGLETIDDSRQKALGAKLTTPEFNQAIANLLSAGFEKENIGAYLLVGLPEQKTEEAQRSVDAVLNLGIRPHLAEYSPTPQSPFFEKAKAFSRFDLSEPLFHNPTLLPLANASFNEESLQALKARVRSHFSR